MSNNSNSRVGQLVAQLHSLRVRELTIILSAMSLARSGRKQDLVDRITNALQQLESKAQDNSTNQAAVSYYKEQLNTGIRAIETVLREARQCFTPSTSPTTLQHVVHTNNSLSGRITPPLPSSYASNPYDRQSTHRPAHSSTPTPHNGVERFIPTKIPELNGARCFCPTTTSTSNSSNLITCHQCSIQVHAKCHQLVMAPPEEWYCEKCRTALVDPYVQVLRTVVPMQFVRFIRRPATYPQSSTPGPSIFRIEYHLTGPEVNSLYTHREAQEGAMTLGSQQLQLRCFILKEGLATGTSWPTTTILKVNGINVPIIQRAPPGNSTPSKVLREVPVNLFQYSREGRNLVEVGTGEQPLIYCFCIQVVTFYAVDTLITQVIQASANITYEDAKKRVIQSFKEEEDNGIETMSTVLSIRCPLGLCIITLPARGVYCKHLQCFDLKTFLLFNKKAKSRAYLCTICHTFIKTSDLRIDPYLKQILNDVAGDDELEEVEISPDATWKCRQNEEVTGSQPPAGKKLKREHSSEPRVETIEGGSMEPLEIDLCLSSDDEGVDERTTTTPPALRPLSGGPVVDPPPLDDEVSILTVDPDVWESSMSHVLPSTRGTNGGGMLLFPSETYPTYGGNGNMGLSSSWNPLYPDMFPPPPSLPLPPPPPPAPLSIKTNPLFNGTNVPTSTPPSSSSPFLNAYTDLPPQPLQTPPSMGHATSQDVLDVIDLLDTSSDEDG